MHDIYVTEDELKQSIHREGVKNETELYFRMCLIDNGIIDRIDIYEAESCLEACIIDYKTNSLKDRAPRELAGYYKP